MSPAVAGRVKSAKGVRVSRLVLMHGSTRGHRFAYLEHSHYQTRRCR
jgi:hypothetical protein